MEQVKLKKEMIQVVKIFFLILFIILNGISVSSQSIVGKYEYKWNSFESNFNLELKNNNRFISTQTGHLNYTKLGKGYYSLVKDTLVIMYEAWADPNPSIYKVLNKQYNASDSLSKLITNITLTVLDNSQKPIAGSSIFLLKENNIVSIILADKNGVSLVYTEGKFLDSIKVSFIGYKSLTIPLKKLYGYNADLLLEMNKDLNLYEENIKILKFKVIAEDGVVISLIPIENNLQSTLIRSD